MAVSSKAKNAIIATGIAMSAFSFAANGNEDETSLIDMAFENFNRIQKLYEANLIKLKPLKAAAKILKYSERFESKEQLPSAKEYGNLAANTVSLKSLQSAGLISIEDFNSKLGLSPALARTAQETRELNDDFFTKHGASLAYYPDAVPGGPEPYVIKKGDTLQSLAARFINAMGADNEQQALSMILKKNGFTPDAKLTPGDTLLLPVPPEHQIGTTKIEVSDTLVGTIIKVATILKTDSLEQAYELIIKENDFIGRKADEIFKVGAIISIPATEQNKAQKITIEPYDTLAGIAYKARHVFDAHEESQHKAGASIEGIIEEIMRLNNLDRETPLKTGQPLWLTFFNDGYTHMKKLSPPETYDPNHKVNLVVTEAFNIKEGGTHFKNTFSVAVNTAYALNPSVDFSRFYALKYKLLAYNPLTAPNALRILLNLDGSPLQDNVIFSHSMAGANEESAYDAEKPLWPADHIDYEETRINLDRINKAKPIVFTAAGNYHIYIDKEEDSDGHYKQSYLLTHSPRSVNYGMLYANENDQSKTISEDSSFGGDICFTMPTLFKNKRNGTSFTVQEGAAVMRQFMEWYGNILNFEEIMAVGMMTADKDILDLDIAEGYYKETPDGKKRPIPAIFNTNGGGLPVHGRCGAGNWDADSVVLWREKLDKMVGFKQSLKEPNALYSENIEFGEAAEVSHNESGKSEYTYSITVPEDMTLLKLEFLLPQNKGQRSAKIKVRTPAGFERTLPKSIYDVVPTQWFNYEDVKAGDAIEITAAHPLAETAGIYLRGMTYKDGKQNTIQMMRAHLHSENILPTPLKTMHGNKIVEDQKARLEI